MKISELIEHLQQLKDDNGDLRVWVFGSYNELQKDQVYAEYTVRGYDFVKIDRD